MLKRGAGRMKKLYVAVDIGCIECGESSAVLGIFTDKNKAWDVLDEHEKRQGEHWRGQHYFDVYEVNEIDQEIRIEY